MSYRNTQNSLLKKHHDHHYVQGEVDEHHEQDFEEPDPENFDSDYEENKSTKTKKKKLVDKGEKEALVCPTCDKSFVCKRSFQKHFELKRCKGKKFEFSMLG